MSVQIQQNSRLSMTDLLEVEGVEFWDTVVFPPIPHSEDDVEHTVVAGERLDLIAQRYYGDPILWWYIAVASDLELLPVDLSEGDILRVPPLSYLSTYISMRRRD